MADIHHQYALSVAPEVVWKLLTNPDYINAWGGGPASIDDKVGTEFELWGGDIWGKNTEIKKNKLLKQEWYAGEWPQASIVTFQIQWDKTLKKTVITLDHNSFPDSELANLTNGWDKSFFGKIHEYVLANTQPVVTQQTSTQKT